MFQGFSVGALGATRTRGLQSRSLTLYPTELRAHALLSQTAKKLYHSERELVKVSGEEFPNDPEKSGFSSLCQEFSLDSQGKESIISLSRV